MSRAAFVAVADARRREEELAAGAEASGQPTALRSVAHGAAEEARRAARGDRRRGMRRAQHGTDLLAGSCNA